MKNSGQLKDSETGKYARLPICPVCGKKVHIEEDDINAENWGFDGQGEFTHDDCFSEVHLREGE